MELSKNFIKKEREKWGLSFLVFFVLFLSGQEKCGVGNHAFFRPMNKIVFFFFFFLLTYGIERGGKIFSEIFFWIIF